MGCPEGMSKIHYTRLALEIWFVTVYFSGIKAVIITSKRIDPNDLFCLYYLLLGKLWEGAREY